MHLEVISAFYLYRLFTYCCYTVHHSSSALSLAGTFHSCSSLWPHHISFQFWPRPIEFNAAHQRFLVYNVSPVLHGKFVLLKGFRHVAPMSCFFEFNIVRIELLSLLIVVNAVMSWSDAAYGRIILRNASFLQLYLHIRNFIYVVSYL